MIGAIGGEGEGLFGIEASEEDVLDGTDGEVAITSDALGQEIGRDVTTGAAAGHDVELTVDARIQAYTEKVIDGIGDKYQPVGATAIVMNPADGDVLAMASWPPVDPTDLTDADPEQLSNLATGLTYEPGSTFKAFTVAGALEEGLVTPETTFDLPPTIQVADRTIEESHEGGFGTLSVSQILAFSSNVGAVTIGLELGEKRFDDWVHRFGFGTPTGIDFPLEEQGIVPGVKDYSGSSIGNLPIGQGLAVTPIQMMAAYAAIANGGTLRTPRLIKSIDGEDVAAGRGPSGDQRADLRRAAPDARGRARRGRHRIGGPRPRLRARRQDRNLAEGDRRDLLRQPVRRLVRRLRPGGRSEAPRRGDRGRSARAITTAAPSPHRPSGRSPSSPFRTSESRRRSRAPRCPPAAFLESRP